MRGRGGEVEAEDFQRAHVKRSAAHANESEAQRGGGVEKSVAQGFAAHHPGRLDPVLDRHLTIHPPHIVHEYCRSSSCQCRSRSPPRRSAHSTISPITGTLRTSWMELAGGSRSATRPRVWGLATRSRCRHSVFRCGRCCASTAGGGLTRSVGCRSRD